MAPVTPPVRAVAPKPVVRQTAVNTADGAPAFLRHHHRHLRLRFTADPVQLPPAGPRAVADAAGNPPQDMIVVGDSLAVGMASDLRTALDGWRMWVDARVGRPLAEGMGVLDAAPIPSSGAVVAVSLFTNDGPGNLTALEAAVRHSVALAGPHGCALWATIQRPPLAGVSYAAANALLERLAGDPSLSGRLVVVPWAREVAAHPELLAGDHVHGTAAGYAERARLYAQAARSCRG